MVVPPQQQMEYSSLIPNYSAPSSVCTSDSGGGSSQGRLRTIRLHRRFGGQHGGPPTFGFSVRGGREHGTGFFVSAVEPGSEAHCQGLRIGDQIVRINGFSVVDAVHREVLQYIQSQNYLELRVRTVGMIPVKDKRTDPLTWRVVEDERLQVSPDICKPACNGNNEDVMRDVRLFLNMGPRMKLGCGICKGPEWKPGIFVQFTKENGLAREAGLRPGDQILQCNGVPFVDVPFSQAVNVLKSTRQLDLIIRKGAGLDLFPGESSGYNSSASSVNGDQSPNWGDIKRLSIVKEESIELDDRLGPFDSSNNANPRIWNQHESTWDKTDSKQRRKDSPVLRVRFEDSGNERNIDEANRDMSELSLVSSDRDNEKDVNRQHPEQRYDKNNAKLAEICMVSQQLETKTVIVEVHQSEETSDRAHPSQNSSQRLGSEEDTKKYNNLTKSESRGSVASESSNTGSSLSSAISQELQRRSKQKETQDYTEVDRKKDFLKSIDGERRQQHDQLMDEFKRVHQKMFAHNAVTENERNNSCHTESSHLRITHSVEERETIQTKRPHNNTKEEKTSLQRKVITTRENNFQDGQGVSETTREVTMLTKISKGNVPPPPPPMPTGSSSFLHKPTSPALSQASIRKASLLERPPSTPTPDYDTSSTSSVSSHVPSLIIVNKNPAPSPHHNKTSQSHNTPMYATVNKSAKSTQRLPTTNGSSSQKLPKNNESVEMQSIESFTLTNPQSTKPKPPDIYFVPLRNKQRPQNGSSQREEKSNKQRPVSITIGEYPSGVERRIPTRFDFLQSHAAEARKSTVNLTSETDGFHTSYQLQSELAQTLSRSNLKKQSDIQEPLSNGISKASGTVTISVNNQSPILAIPRAGSVDPKSHQTNNTNKTKLENNTKISIISSDQKYQDGSVIKSAIRAGDKVTSNRVTIVVPNGVQSKQ